MRITLEEIIERHKKSNPNTDYDYGKTVLGQTLHDKVIITCPIHGDFIQAPHEHMKGQGCPKCAIEQKAINKRTDIEELIRKSKEKFGNKFNIFPKKSPSFRWGMNWDYFFFCEDIKRC